MIHNLYSQIISLNNLLAAYYEFRRGKRNKEEVGGFEIGLEENIFVLHKELKSLQYRHSDYSCFKIYDPKPRIIHKASVKDRVVHQAVYRILYPIFDKSFIFDSYSSRLRKGTHKAVKRLGCFTKKVSKNYKNPCYALKVDIEKFFHSIDQIILIRLLKNKIQCPKTIWLLREIIESFSIAPDKGLPLGNVTSQLWANIYLSQLDYFIKNQLREKYYLRFCDDFIILRPGPDFTDILPKIKPFLAQKLLLKIKMEKIKIRKLIWGFDFLGYVCLPYHNILRPRTKKRMFGKIKEKKILLQNDLLAPEKFEQILNSYYGLLKHCHSYKLKEEMENYV